MSIDERILILLNPKYPERIGAIGLRFSENDDWLVGLYLLYSNQENVREALGDIVRTFREARLYTPSELFEPALVCKMAIQNPTHAVLEETFSNYRKIKLDLLEARASNPKVFLSLRFDEIRNGLDYRSVVSLKGVDSNYSCYIPN